MTIFLGDFGDFPLGDWILVHPKKQNIAWNFGEHRSHNTPVEPGTLLWSAPDMTSELTHYNIYLAEAGVFEMLFVWALLRPSNHITWELL